MIQSDETVPGPEPTVAADAEADTTEAERITGRPVTRVARFAVGTAVIAGEQSVAVVVGIVSKTRNNSARRATTIRDRILAAIAEAETRGRKTLAGGRSGAGAVTDSAVNGAVAWAQVKVIPQVIEGALPEIKARVIPALIDDMTNDPRVRDLILAQSRGVLGQMTEQLRTGTARADDRVEATAHRMFGRNDKTPGGPAKGLNEIRGS